MQQIQATMNNLWGRWGAVDVIEWENESFIVKFEDKKTKKWGTLVLPTKTSF